MIVVEIYARNTLLFLYYRNNFEESEYTPTPPNKSINFCKNGELFKCVIANNSSTVLGVIIVIVQAVVRTFIAILVSKGKFADKGKQKLLNYSLAFGIGYFNTVLIPVLNGFFFDL